MYRTIYKSGEKINLTHDFCPFPTNVTALAFRTEPVIFFFQCWRSGSFQTGGMNRRSALRARNKCFMLTLAILLAGTKTFGTEKRCRLHLCNNKISIKYIFEKENVSVASWRENLKVGFQCEWMNIKEWGDFPTQTHSFQASEGAELNKRREC